MQELQEFHEKRKITAMCMCINSIYNNILSQCGLHGVLSRITDPIRGTIEFSQIGHRGGIEWTSARSWEPKRHFSTEVKSKHDANVSLSVPTEKEGYAMTVDIKPLVVDLLADSVESLVHSASPDGQTISVSKFGEITELELMSARELGHMFQRFVLTGACDGALWVLEHAEIPRFGGFVKWCCFTELATLPRIPYTRVLPSPDPDPERVRDEFAACAVKSVAPAIDPTGKVVKACEAVRLACKTVQSVSYADLALPTDGANRAVAELSRSVDAIPIEAMSRTSKGYIDAVRLAAAEVDSTALVDHLEDHGASSNLTLEVFEAVALVGCHSAPMFELLPTILKARVADTIAESVIAGKFDCSRLEYPSEQDSSRRMLERFVHPNRTLVDTTHDKFNAIEHSFNPNNPTFSYTHVDGPRVTGKTLLGALCECASEQVAIIAADVLLPLGATVTSSTAQHEPPLICAARSHRHRLLSVLFRARDMRGSVRLLRECVGHNGASAVAAAAAGFTYTRSSEFTDTIRVLTDAGFKPTEPELLDPAGDVAKAMDVLVTEHREQAPDASIPWATALLQRSLEALVAAALHRAKEEKARRALVREAAVLTVPKDDSVHTTTTLVDTARDIRSPRPDSDGAVDGILGGGDGGLARSVIVLGDSKHQRSATAAPFGGHVSHLAQLGDESRDAIARAGTSASVPSTNSEELAKAAIRCGANIGAMMYSSVAGYNMSAFTAAMVCGSADVLKMMRRVRRPNGGEIYNAWAYLVAKAEQDTYLADYIVNLPEFNTIRLPIGETLLHNAAATCKYGSIVRTLHNADPKWLDWNATNESGETPLHIACARGDAVLCLVRELVARGRCDATVANREHSNAVHIAAGSSSMHLIGELLVHPQWTQCLDAVDSSGNTPLHVACEFGTFQTVRVILENGGMPYVATRNNAGCTPLHLAARSARDPMKKIRGLIANKASLLDVDHFGRNALHHVCETTHGESGTVVATILRYSPNMLRIPRGDGASPLDIATSFGNQGCIDALNFAHRK